MHLMLEPAGDSQLGLIRLQKNACAQPNKYARHIERSEVKQPLVHRMMTGFSPCDSGVPATFRSGAPWPR